MGNFKVLTVMLVLCLATGQILGQNPADTVPSDQISGLDDILVDSEVTTMKVSPSTPTTMNLTTEVSTATPSKPSTTSEDPATTTAETTSTTPAPTTTAETTSTTPEPTSTEEPVTTNSLPAPKPEPFPKNVGTWAVGSADKPCIMLKGAMQVSTTKIKPTEGGGDETHYEFDVPTEAIVGGTCNSSQWIALNWTMVEQNVMYNLSLVMMFEEKEDQKYGISGATFFFSNGKRKINRKVLMLYYYDPNGKGY